MPYALLLFGLVLLVAGVRGKHKDLFALVKGDFTGDGNFVYWLIALAIVGGAGYIKPLKPVSVAFMTLLLIVLLLSNKGIIPKLEQFLKGGTIASGAGVAPDVNVTPRIPALPTISDINTNLGSIP